MSSRAGGVAACGAAGRLLAVADRTSPRTGGRRGRRRPSCLGVALAYLVLGAGAAAQAGQSALATHRAASAVQQRVAALLAELPADTRVGLYVADAADGGAWVMREPDVPLKPASVMKLFVTAAALARLGPDFAYRTRLYLLDGELLVQGSGDPALGDERVARRHGRTPRAEFDDWAGALHARGVTALRTIALDDSIFDQEYRHPDWPADQAQKWYQAPVGGINFNDNCLDVRYTAGNGQVLLTMQPELPAAFFTNRLRVDTRHAPVAQRRIDADVFEFVGTVARAGSFDPISVGRPSVFFGHALAQALQRRGIAITGNVVRRRLAADALRDAELLDTRATPLADVVWRCNTFSQNLFAECLLKSLAAYAPDGRPSGVAGSWAGGVQVLEATLRQLGLNLDGAVFRDGSGLSHRNRATARQIVQLLLAMQHHAGGSVFIDSLADAGEAGTMRQQYGSAVLRGRLRGKTGTLAGVRSLAGYVDRPDGRTLAFALLVEGTARPDWPRRLAEALVASDARPAP